MLEKEFDSKITQLETALRSKIDSNRQDVQGSCDHHDRPIVQYS